MRLMDRIELVPRSKARQEGRQRTLHVVTENKEERNERES